MQTPSFCDTKHQIKAKPIFNMMDTPGNFLNKPKAKVPSVFSPIPCNPNHNAAFSELEVTTILHILHSTDNKNRQLQKYLQSQDLQQEGWKILHKITGKKRLK